MSYNFSIFLIIYTNTHCCIKFMNMKKTLLSLALALFSFALYSQMTVDNSPSPEDVANALVGEGVTISNITWIHYLRSGTKRKNKH